MSFLNSETSSGPLPKYSAKRTSHLVNFYCDAAEAKTVQLVGDFNAWNATSTPMHRAPDGRWAVTVQMHHGHHRYLFLVDGAPRLDPEASGVARNDRDERVSLIAVS